MAITVVPTELSSDGKTIERRDRALMFDSIENARIALGTTVARLMSLAGMEYDEGIGLEENVELYYNATGHAFGWVIEGASTPVAPAVPQRLKNRIGLRILRLLYLFFAIVFFSIIATPFGNALVLLHIATPANAAFLVTAVRALLVLAFLILLAQTTGRYRQNK